MAAVSAFPSGRDLSSSNGLEDDSSTWNYGRTTTQEQHLGTSFSKPFSSANQPSSPKKIHLAPFTKQQVNGTSKYSHAAAQHLGSQQEPLKSSQAALSNQTKEGNYLSPHKHGGSRPTMADASRSGSENDSLLDLYGHPISAAESMERRDRTSPQPTLPQADPLFTLEDEDPERSRWIHRDKLAMIESHEMQEAGIKLPRHSSLHGRSGSTGSRSRSRKSHSRGASRDLPVAGNQEQEHELLPRREGKRPRTRSPQKQQQEAEIAVADIPDYDLRTPEEIASDSSPVYRQQGLRSSSSRIPLSTSTAMPIPQEHRERHTPLPRMRGASGSWPSGDEDGVVYNNKLRRRSQSVGSQIILDSDELLKSNGTSNGTNHVLNVESPMSISKQHAAETKVTPSNHARKASATLRNVSEPQKARVAFTTSRSSPASQPKSRSGVEPRPATAIDRLEGEAPWIADMYKPDPRLPPDQQLVPTHAKRLQQKQLEEEAKANASTPPRSLDFNPVAVHTQNGLQPPSPSVARSPRDLNEKSPAENQVGWPLNVSPKPSIANVNGSTNSNRGGNSPSGASDHAGYSTIPKVRSTPPIESAPSPKLDQQPMRREMEKQVKEKEPSCGCCIVM